MARSCSIGAVDPSTHDAHYTTIVAWEASLSRSTNGEETGELIDSTNYDEDARINAAVSGTNRIILTVASGVRHDGTFGTGARNDLTSGTGYPFLIQTDYVTIEWLSAGNDTNNRYSYVTGSDNVVVRNCVLWSGDAGGNGLRINNSDDCEVHDCFITNTESVGGSWRGLYIDSSADNLIVTHTTIYNFVREGFWANGSFTAGNEPTLTNCIGIDNGDSGSRLDFTGTFHSDTDYLVSADSSASAEASANSWDSETSAIFEDDTVGAPDLRLVSGEDGSFDGDATPPGSYSNGVDIVGTTRTDFDCGGFEIVGGGGGGGFFARRYYDQFLSGGPR